MLALNGGGRVTTLVTGLVPGTREQNDDRPAHFPGWSNVGVDWKRAAAQGIEKGKPFKPADRLRKILAEATVVGKAVAKANDFEKRGMETAHYARGK
jgi:hypothetical protein